MVDLAIWIISAVGFIILFYFWIHFLYYATGITLFLLPLFFAYKMEATPVGWGIAIILQVALFFAAFKSGLIYENKRKTEAEPADEMPRQFSEPSHTIPKNVISPVEPISVFEPIEEKNDEPIAYSQRNILDRLDDLELIRKKLTNEENRYLTECGIHYQLCIDRSVALGYGNPENKKPISEKQQYELLAGIDLLLNESLERLRQHKFFDEDSYSYWLTETIWRVRDEAEH